MDEDSNQKTTILNLFNSGLEPETISLELDIDEDIVIEIIEKEKNKNKKGRTDSKSSMATDGDACDTTKKNKCGDVTEQSISHTQSSV